VKVARPLASAARAESMLVGGMVGVRLSCRVVLG
jgi:hypothetical protein